MTKFKWLVSTILCTYNAERFIKDTLDSILNQTYKNQEILIRDDGSTDKTIEILEKYQKKDSRIKIWTSKEVWKKLGAYGGLNFLLDQSKWEFIAVQDHDDIWHSKKLELQVDFLNKNKDFEACGTNSIYVYYHKKVLLANKNSWLWYPTHTSLMYRNNWYRYDLSDKIWLDIVFIMKILKKIYILPLVGVIRRFFWTNLSFQWQKNIKEYYSFYKKHKDITNTKLLAYNLYRWLFPNLSFYLSVKFFSKKKYIKLDETKEVIIEKLKNIYQEENIDEKSISNFLK